jgi:hypothetical protein
MLEYFRAINVGVFGQLDPRRHFGQ